MEEMERREAETNSTAKASDASPSANKNGKGETLAMLSASDLLTPGREDDAEGVSARDDGPSFVPMVHMPPNTAATDRRKSRPSISYTHRGSSAQEAANDSAAVGDRRESHGVGGGHRSSGIASISSGVRKRSSVLIQSLQPLAGKLHDLMGGGVSSESKNSEGGEGGEARRGSICSVEKESSSALTTESNSESTQKGTGLMPVTEGLSCTQPTHDQQQHDGGKDDKEIHDRDKDTEAGQIGESKDGESKIEGTTGGEQVIAAAKDGGGDANSKGVDSTIESEEGMVEEVEVVELKSNRSGETKQSDQKQSSTTLVDSATLDKSPVEGDRRASGDKPRPPIGIRGALTAKRRPSLSTVARLEATAVDLENKFSGIPGLATALQTLIRAGIAQEEYRQKQLKVEQKGVPMPPIKPPDVSVVSTLLAISRAASSWMGPKTELTMRKLNNIATLIPLHMSSNPFERAMQQAGLTAIATICKLEEGHQHLFQPVGVATAVMTAMERFQAGMCNQYCWQCKAPPFLSKVCSWDSYLLLWSLRSVILKIPSAVDVLVQLDQHIANII
jgi:hypothetical protein